MIASVNEGEDVPLIAEFFDPDVDGNPALDPDDTDATADGVADAFVTVEYEDGTLALNNVEMARLDVGRFEYVWDTATDGVGPGSYEVRATAEFGGETKILKDEIRVR